MPSATSGNMTWAQIRKAFIEAAGDTTAARQEAFAHLSQGFREIVQAADVPEVFSEAVFNIPSNPLSSTSGQNSNTNEFQDFFDLDTNVYHIDSMFNLTISAPIYMEPSGMPGRDRYIDANPDIPATPTDDVFDNPSPPPGQVRWYVRHGNRIYVRDAPDRKTKVRIRFRVQPDPITEDDVNSHPFLPPHLDWAIVWASASNYYKAHRDQNVVGQQLQSDYYEQQATKLLTRPKHVDGEEEKNSFYRMRVAGYRIAPRSRRSGGY